jgi:hypothetical protein
VFFEVTSAYLESKLEYQDIKQAWRTAGRVGPFICFEVDPHSLG